MAHICWDWFFLQLSTVQQFFFLFLSLFCLFHKEYGQLPSSQSGMHSVYIVYMYYILIGYHTEKFHSAFYEKLELNVSLFIVSKFLPDDAV